MESDKPTSEICSLLAIDHKDYCYRACSSCERVLPDSDDSSSSFCRFCNFNKSKRFFRVLMSIATDSKVKTVVCFDRAAKVLFGCSADEFFNFVKLHPSAAETAGQILEGELFMMNLTSPKNGNAQHLRIASITPLRSDYQPAVVSLREFYRQEASLTNP